MRPREWIRGGVLGGIVTIFLALVGLIGRFTDLNIVGEAITFALLTLFAAPFVTGYAVSRPRVEAGERIELDRRQAIVAGVVAGAVAGLVFGAAVVFADAFGVERIRAVFLNVTEELIEFVTFGLPPVAGALLLTAMSAVAGALGSGLRVTPERIRKPITAAALSVLLLGFLQRIVPIALDQLSLEREWLYDRSTGGLTWIGAAVVAAVAAILSDLKARKGERLRALIFPPSGEAADEGVAPLRFVALAVVAGALIALPWIVGDAVSQVLGTVLIYVLLGIGLNIVVGYAGLLDLGYVFFFAVGAYATALLTGAMLNTFTGSGPPAISADLNFYVAIPIVLVIAAVAGLLIGAPVLRLRGDYLALVTLGLGEMVTVLVRSPWLEPLVGGPNGMRGVTDAAIGGFGFRDPQHFYYLAMAFVIAALFVSYRLSLSRIGRAWTAMREDEQTADAMGVSITRFKLLAFAMGGAIGSLGGAMFAVQIGSLTPASFRVEVSILVLGLVILGGLGSLPGVITGALVLVGLPGLLREFEEYRGLAYGAAIVAVMVLRPQGLVPNIRRSRELHDEEASQDEWVQAEEEQARAGAGAGEVVT
ncbi:MAG TPA: leucine/isoleucine/valine transporter permease subunit [Actinomycetota bacterium]|nr:leucine/isoleucine/valine transporter permease subunit [Actinomycetota bacterium]